MAKSNDAFIHGEYVKVDDTEDAYIGFFKDMETNETKMRIVKNPMVRIWITKPGYRTYTAKKEWSRKSELDEYTTRYKDRAETIWNALNSDPSRPRWKRMPFLKLRDQMSSPFVYGADIEIGSRMKYAAYRANGERRPLNFNTGFLDIETDVNGTNQIILITFANHDGKTYVGILKEFFGKHTIEEVKNMWENDVEPKFHQELTDEKALKAYESSPKVQLFVQLFDDEVGLIKWIFDNIHLCRPDFINIWNIGYDIPYIIERVSSFMIFESKLFNISCTVPGSVLNKVR